MILVFDLCGGGYLESGFWIVWNGCFWFVDCGNDCFWCVDCGGGCLLVKNFYLYSITFVLYHADDIFFFLNSPPSFSQFLGKTEFFKLKNIYKFAQYKTNIYFYIYF